MHGREKINKTLHVDFTLHALHCHEHSRKQLIVASTIKKFRHHNERQNSQYFRMSSGKVLNHYLSVPISSDNVASTRGEWEAKGKWENFPFAWKFDDFHLPEIFRRFDKWLRMRALELLPPKVIQSDLVIIKLSYRRLVNCDALP